MKMELFGQTKEILLNDILKILIRKYNLLDNSNKIKKEKNFESIISSIPQSVKYKYGIHKIKTLEDVMKCEILYLENSGNVNVGNISKETATTVELQVKYCTYWFTGYLFYFKNPKERLKLIDNIIEILKCYGRI